MGHAAQLLLGVISALTGAGDPGTPAPAAPDEPLLVIVERSHGATTSPEQIRRAIAEELHRPVVGPADAAGKTASQMLVVTIAPDSVAMQLRSAGEQAARRRIEPLTSGDSGLQVVAWLAGNLARDQATELMDALPAAALATAPPTSLPPVAATQPPPQPPANAEAPPAAVVAASPAAETTERPDGEAPWRLEFSIGRVANTPQELWLRGEAFDRIEVLAPSRPGHWSWTAGLDVINEDLQDHSYALSGGLARRFMVVPRWLAADATCGLGLIFTRSVRLETVQTTGGDMSLVTNETFGPTLLAHLSVTLAFVRFRVGEIVASARIGDRPEDVKDPWFAFSAGLRIALQ